jgi:hypothetical protein
VQEIREARPSVQTLNCLAHCRGKGYRGHVKAGVKAGEIGGWQEFFWLRRVVRGRWGLKRARATAGGRRLRRASCSSRRWRWRW